MKRSLGVLLEEKIRLTRALEELDKCSDNDPLNDLAEHIKQDIYYIDEALEVVQKHFSEIY